MRSVSIFTPFPKESTTEEIYIFKKAASGASFSQLSHKKQ